MLRRGWARARHVSPADVTGTLRARDPYSGHGSHNNKKARPRKSRSVFRHALLLGTADVAATTGSVKDVRPRRGRCGLALQRQHAFEAPQAGGPLNMRHAAIQVHARDFRQPSAPDTNRERGFSDRLPMNAPASRGTGALLFRISLLLLGPLFPLAVPTNLNARKRVQNSIPRTRFEGCLLSARARKEGGRNKNQLTCNAQESVVQDNNSR